MSPSPRDSFPAGSREEVQRRFQAWKEAILAAFEGLERSHLCSELDTLERTYAQRLGLGEEPAHVTVEHVRATVRDPNAPLANATQQGSASTVPQPGDVVGLPPLLSGEAIFSLQTLLADTMAYEPHDPADATAARPGPGPRTVAGYEVLGRLGQGAMGVVYKARHIALKRIVALKMIRAGEHASAHDLLRFRREAEAVARFAHPGIVQIYEVGEAGGQPYLSLEYVDGASLDKKIHGAPLPPVEAARLAQKLAEAMEYAHQHCVIHRDLKPTNVLLTAEGAPKISDFGLARRLEEDVGQTRSGTILGTPSYMSPEQAEGKIHEVGPLADVYSLGAILYELLTGRPPFRAATLLETLQQVCTQEPVAPTQFQPSLPRDLETICLKCLHKEPARRFTCAEALAQELRRFLAGEPILARPVGSSERLWRWCRRNPRTAILGAVVALLVVVWAATASLLAGRLKIQQDETNSARVEADANAQEAGRQAVLADENMRKAQREAIIARWNEKTAKETAGVTFRQVLDLGAKLHDRLQRKHFRDSLEARRLREEMLALLRKSLDNLSKQLEMVGTSSFARAAFCQGLGDLLVKLGQGAEALRVYQKGHDLVKDVVAAEPNNDVARANLGVMRLRLGNVALVMGDARTALTWYRQARDLHVDVFTRPRSGFYKEMDARRILSHDDIQLGRARMALGQSAEARKAFQEALTARQTWAKAQPSNLAARSYVMEAQMWFGVASGRLADAKAAQEHFDHALRIGAELVKQKPKDLSFLADMAEVQGARGDVLLQLDKVEEADKSYRDSLRNLQRAIAGNPDDMVQQSLLVQTYKRLAAVSRRQGKNPEAATNDNKALELRLELLQIEPDNLVRQAAHLLALARCGKHAETAQGAAKLRPRIAHSPELLLQLARCFAVCAASGAGQKHRYTEQALEALQTATRADYKDAATLRTDPDLEALRTEPAFKTLVGQGAAIVLPPKP